MTELVITLLVLVICGLVVALYVVTRNKPRHIQEHSPEVYEWIQDSRFAAARAEMELHDIDVNCFIAMAEHAVKRFQQGQQP